MKKNQIVIILFVSVSFIITLLSCSSAEPTVTSTITPPQSPTTTPTKTPLPSHTPTQQPDQTSTPTPNAAFLPGTGNSLFPIPTISSRSVMSPPTPIPTASQNYSAYKLKDWSDEDALTSVQMIDQFAYAKGITTAAGGSYYLYLHPMINLITSEALSRFPNSNDYDEIKWKQAILGFRGTTGIEPPTAWIMAQIQDALNSPQYSLDTINNFLKPRGVSSFSVIIENLKGDGKDGYLLQISPLYDFYEAHITFLVTETEGQYTLSSLPEPLSDVHIYQILNHIEPDFQIDQNEDNIPEIAFIAWGQRRCMLRVLEWRPAQDQLVDISGREMYCNTGWSTPTYYNFGPSKPEGVDLITVHEFIYGTKLYWKRVEDSYELIEERHENPLEYMLNAIEYNPNDRYSITIDNFQQVLDDWESSSSQYLKFYQYDVSTEDKDIWRLNLGFATLLTNQSKGIQIIQEVADSPEYPDEPIPGAIAAVFLEHFSGGRDQLLPACRAVTQKYEDMVSGNASEPMWDSSPTYKHIAYFCNSKDVMVYVIQAYSSNPISQLINHLSQFPEISIRQETVNDKTLYFVNHQFRAHENQTLILYQNGGSIDYLYPGIIYSPINLTPVQLPGMNGNVYQFTDEYESTYYLEFDFSTSALTVNLLGEFWYSDFLENITINDQLYYYALYTDETTQEDVCDRYNMVYFNEYWWNQENRQFQEINLLEYLIFEEQAYPQAIQIIQQYLQYIEPLYQNSIERENSCEIGILGINLNDDTALEYPRLRYLLGLAYELNGDTELAAQTYYQLWQEAPNSGYALIARAKLEEIP